MTSLQETALAMWVSSSPSIFGYPAILTLHTIGLALLVGANIVIDLRLLGAARSIPLPAMLPFFPIMWVGLAINTLSGILLFIADAVNKAGQPVFRIKLICIAGAIAVLLMIRPLMARAGAAGGDPANSWETSVAPLSPRGMFLAVVSLVLWTAAMTAGRLVAYLR